MLDIYDPPAGADRAGFEFVPVPPSPLMPAVTAARESLWAAMAAVSVRRLPAFPVSAIINGN